MMPIGTFFKASSGKSAFYYGYVVEHLKNGRERVIKVYDYGDALGNAALDSFWGAAWFGSIVQCKAEELPPRVLRKIEKHKAYPVEVSNAGQ